MNEDLDQGPAPPGSGRRPRWALWLAAAAGFIAVGWMLMLVASFLNPPPASVVGGITAGTPAQIAGLLPADRILAVGGQPTRTLFDVFKYVFDAGGEALELEIRRGGSERTVQIPTTVCFGQDGSFFPERLGIEAPSLTRVLRVIDGQPAAKAGLRGGDWIREINGRPVEVWAQVVEAVQQSGGQPIVVVVDRQGAIERLKVTPEVQIWRDLTGKPILDERGKPQMRPLMGAVGDMGQLYGTQRSLTSALWVASEHTLLLALAIPARLAQVFAGGDRGAVSDARARASLSVDLEQGLIEAARPWYHSLAELFVLAGLVLIPVALYNLVRERRAAAAAAAA